MINFNNIKRISLSDLGYILFNSDMSKVDKDKIIKLKVFYDIAFYIFDLDFPMEYLEEYFINGDRNEASIKLIDFIGLNLKNLGKTTAPNISILDSLDLMTEQAFSEGNVKLVTNY